MKNLETKTDNLTTIETWLPIFQGFYGTLFEPDAENEIYSINQERENKGLDKIDYDKCNWDNQGYENEISVKACEFIEGKLNEIGIKSTIEFQRVNSPKEYNFKNDSIDCKITLDLDLLYTYLVKNRVELSKYFKDQLRPVLALFPFILIILMTGLIHFIPKTKLLA